jgi:hypothetical protein
MMWMLISGSARAAEEVVVYTSEDQVFSEPVLKAFEAKTGITVKAVYDMEETKSMEVISRLMAERVNPQADVFWSKDPVRPIVLQRKDVLTAYRSPNRERIPPQCGMPRAKRDAVMLQALVVNRGKHEVGVLGPDGQVVVPTAAWDRGVEYRVSFVAEKVGTYKLSCETHASTMTASILVLSR